MTALTCPDCQQTYERRAGHCRGGRYGGCCSSFATGSGFDAHRTGPFTDRRCLTVQERLAAGWHTDERGYWRSPADDANSEALAAFRAAKEGDSKRPNSHGNRIGGTQCHPRPENGPIRPTCALPTP